MAFVPVQLGSYDPAAGMGFSLKKTLKKAVKIVTKPVVSVAKVVTTPVRAVASSVVSIVDPKLAHEITPEISKKDFKNIGNVGKGVAAVTAGVLAAPIVAGAAAKVTATGALKTAVGKKILERVAGGLLAPKYEELAAEEQAGMTQEEYDALVKEQEALVAQQAAEAAAKLPATPVATPSSTDPNKMVATLPGTPGAPVVPLEAGAINPFLFMSEEQLAVEKRAVEDAIMYRQSRGLSAFSDYRDFPLLQLYAKRAMIMAAYTPILIKKYSLYAVGGLGIVLLVSMNRRNRKKR